MTELADNALTTLAVIASELDDYSEGDDADVDARVARYINAASSRFENATGRKWYYTEGHEERVAGHGTGRLTVTDHLPVESIDKIELLSGVISGDIQVTAVADSSYEIEDSDVGWIRRTSFGVWKNTARHVTDISTHPRAGTEKKLYRVTYDGGHVTPAQGDDDEELDRTLPYDIEQAIVEYVVMLWQSRGRDATIQSQSSLSGSVTYEMLDGERVPTSFKRLVDSYRLRGVA